MQFIIWLLFFKHFHAQAVDMKGHYKDILLVVFISDIKAPPPHNSLGPWSMTREKVYQLYSKDRGVIFKMADPPVFVNIEKEDVP